MLTLQLTLSIKKNSNKSLIVREEILMTEKENIKNLVFGPWSVFQFRLSAHRGCSAQTDVPVLSQSPTAEGQTGFFITHVSRERESDVKLSLYVTREKTAVSMSSRFPVIFLLSPVLRLLAACRHQWFVQCVVCAESGESWPLWVNYTFSAG